MWEDGTETILVTPKFKGPVADAASPSVTTAGSSDRLFPHFVSAFDKLDIRKNLPLPVEQHKYRS
jgi:hypothetical protein